MVLQHAFLRTQIAGHAWLTGPASLDSQTCLSSSCAHVSACSIDSNHSAYRCAAAAHSPGSLPCRDQLHGATLEPACSEGSKHVQVLNFSKAPLGFCAKDCPVQDCLSFLLRVPAAPHGYLTGSTTVFFSNDAVLDLTSLTVPADASLEDAGPAKLH